MVDEELLKDFLEAKRVGILSRIGKTPLVKIRRIKSVLDIPERVEIWAKIEGLNPGGSVKDRAALFMIEDGIRSGLLTREKAIVDSTSGNTGIAYAMISAALGIRCILFIPANASFERLKILSILSAELMITNPLEGSDGAMKECQKFYEKNPEKYFKPDQYSNPENPKAHYQTTGKEIAEALDEIDFFVVGVGTGGTIMGAGKRLREEKKTKIVAVEPEDPLHGIEGLRNTEYSHIPKIFDVEFPDMFIRVKTEDSYKTAKLLAKYEGLFIGASSGAAMRATEILSKSETVKKMLKEKEKITIVTIFPDLGDRYFSTKLWEDTKFMEYVKKIRWKMEK